MMIEWPTGSLNLGSSYRALYDMWTAVVFMTVLKCSPVPCYNEGIRYLLLELGLKLATFALKRTIIFNFQTCLSFQGLGHL